MSRRRRGKASGSESLWRLCAIAVALVGALSSSGCSAALNFPGHGPSRLAGGTRAHSTVAASAVSPVTPSCLAHTAHVESIPLAALVGILSAEGGRIGEVSRNQNGTVDVGPMQVNSIWAPRLRDKGIRWKRVIDNGCVNVAVGAWILRLAYDHTGNIWAAIGKYHSSSPSLAHHYQRRVWRALHHRIRIKTVLRHANTTLR